MTNPIKGTVVGIANYGIGKTTFALECGYQPKDIGFINDDLKSPGFENEFGFYADLVQETTKMKLLEVHSYCNKLIDNLSESKVIIWDTWARYANTFVHYVKAHENEFRGTKEWAGKPSIRAGEWYNEAWQYQGQQIAKLRNKCDLLIITFHLKQRYENNVVIPGKYRPGHDRAIEKYADLRLWLTPNPNSQVPIGLVLKNISRRNITKQGIRTQQVLPLRLAKCNWDSILEYWENPIGNREPREDERPSAFELSLIEGTLTPEDKRLYESSVSLVEKQLERDEAQELLAKQEQDQVVRKFVQNLNGNATPIIRRKVEAAIKSGELSYDGEITPDKIMEWSE